ncbi:hypothetical protein [Hoeflea sp.]|uniref:hypothetical protein n=1 Tax=Hoeflea sp. TaxID=1940281 RepID=UPI003B527CC6
MCATLAAVFLPCLETAFAQTDCNADDAFEYWLEYLDGTRVGRKIEHGRSFHLVVPFSECLEGVEFVSVTAPSVAGRMWSVHLQNGNPALLDPRGVPPSAREAGTPFYIPDTEISDRLVSAPMVLVPEDAAGVARAGYAERILPEAVR